MIEEHFADYFRNWDIHLPEGWVFSLESGVIRKAGWLIRFLVGEDSRGYYLEFYAAHRMTNDRHLRIYDSGAVEGLDAIWDMCGWDPKVPGAKERARDEYLEHNSRVANELKSLGLYPEGDINAYLRTHDVPLPGESRG